MTDLKQRILRAAAASPSPSCDETRRRRILLMAATAGAMALGWALFALALFGWQPASRPPILFAGSVLGAALVAGATVAVSLGRGRRMLGRSRWSLVATVAVVPLLLLAWKIGWSARFGDLDESPRLGYRCLAISVTMGALPVLLLALSRRGEDPRHPALTGAALGVAVGACAWVLVDLWCPVAGVRHLLRGHLPPIVALGLLGAVLGKLVIAVRARR